MEQNWSGDSETWQQATLLYLLSQSSLHGSFGCKLFEMSVIIFALVLCELSAPRQFSVMTRAHLEFADVAGKMLNVQKFNAKDPFINALAQFPLQCGRAQKIHILHASRGGIASSARVILNKYARACWGKNSASLSTLLNSSRHNITYYRNNLQYEQLYFPLTMH